MSILIVKGVSFTNRPVIAVKTSPKCAITYLYAHAPT